MWEDNSVENRILHGQWSTPSVGTIGGVVQVVSAQGDGWVRGYEAQTGKKLWEFDTNPKDSVWPRTRNELIATPVDLPGRRLHRQRPGPGARRRRRPHVRDRRHQARRHHQDRTGVALRQDPALDLHGRHRRRPAVRLRLQRLPPLPRREDRSGVLESRPAGRRLGVAVPDRRQGLPRRRGRRHRRDGARQGEEAAGRDEHGQRRLRNDRSGERRAFINNRSQLFAIANK